MANGGSIRYSVGFDVNSADLNQLKASLQAIQKQASQVSGTGKLQKEFKEASDAAKKLEQILNSSWNSKLQQFNLDKVNQGINQTYGSVKQLKAEMEKGGAAGAAAYNQVASSLLTTNLQLKQSNKLLDDMAISFANTVKWGISSSIFNNMTSSIQKAWSFTKNLDSSLNDIRIVTDQSAESMEEFAVSANKAAKELGASTLDYTNAALIYYQQGLSAEEVNARAETTLKAANVTGQRGEEVSEQLTAVWNGYKVTAEEAELYVDKLAAVAATTASDLQELSVGMSKVASAANLMGVDVDQLNAQLATIVSITRQAPESVGTALKTIYARMGDIEAGLDGETSLDSYTEKMAQMGYNVLDANGKLRDMGEVITEIGENWQNMSREQQLALSQTVAGTRQYNNLLALFDNWDMYTDALNTSAHAAGTLQKQQDIYMESTEAHLKTLRAETQRTYDLLFNQEVVNGFVDVFSDGLGVLNDFIDGLGGGGKALTYLGSIAAQVFNKQISQGILKAKQSFDLFKANIQGEKFVEALLGEGVSSLNSLQKTGIQDNSAGYQAQLTAMKEIFAVRKGLSQEQYQETLEINKQLGLKTQQLYNLKQQSTLTETHKANLKLLNVEENTLGAIVKENVQNRQADLTEILNGKSALQSLITINDKVLHGDLKREEALKNCNQYMQHFKNYLKQVDVDDDQLDAEWQKVLDAIKQGTFSLSMFSTEIAEAEQKEKEFNMAVEAGTVLLAQQSPEVQKIISNLQKEIDVLKQSNAEYAKRGKQGIDTQKMVKGASAATGAIMALSGSLTTFADASATAEQKSHAVGSALGGIAMAVLPAVSALGPWGMAIGAVVAAISSLVFSLDGVEDFFKTTEEKLEELTQTQQEYINKTKEFTDAKKSLEEVADEYEALAEKAGEYDSTIENLTDTERDRYNELKNTILQYNSEVLIGYNAEGEAILKKNQGIQDTIDLLKEEYEQKVKNQFVDNWKNTKQTLNQQIEDKKSAVDFAQGEVDALESGVKMPSTNDALFVNSQVEEILKYETDAILEQDEAAQQAFDDLRDAWNNGTLTEESINSFITTINETDSPVKDSLINVANSIKDEITSYDTELANAKDILEQSELELQNYKFNTQNILSALKFDVEGNGAEWQQLESLNLDGFDTVVAQYIDNLSYQEGTMDSVDDAIAATREYVSNLYTVLSKLENPQTFLDDVKSFSVVDFDTLEDYNEEAVNKINEIIQSNIALFENMDKEHRKALLEGLFGFSNITFDGLKAISIETPYTNNESAFYEEKYAKAKSSVTSIDNSLNNLLSDDELDQEQLSALDALTSKYEELGQIRDKTSHEYIQALRQIREQEEDNARIALENTKRVKEEELNTLVKEIDDLEILYDNAIAAGNEEGALEYQADLFLKTDEFEAKMKELQEADYSLKMQIDADLASDVDDAFGLADELGNLQELIGEDLTLTFEEAQNIIKQGYGEILQGAKETTEQTIVLNKEQVNAYIEGKENEIQADKEAKIKQLEAQKESLLAQKQSLTAKLTALKEAAEAENAVDAATALAKVQREEANYQAEVKKLEALLKNESESASETEKIDEELYNALGGMYETDSKNQQQAEVDATNTNKAEIDKRIQNVHALHTAYQNLAKQVKAAETGDTIEIGNETTVGGGDIINTQSETVEGQGDYAYNTLTEEDLSEYFKNNQVDEAYKNTINALIDATQTEIDGLDNQLGAIDAGIAALKSAGSSLDKYQKDLSTKKDSSGSKDKQDMDLVKDKVDIYHDLNLELKNLSNTMDKLGKQEKKLYGTDLINNLNQQLVNLQQQVEAQQEKLALAQQEAAIYRNNLASQGVNFNSDGTISNYASILQSKQNYVNGLISQYNAMSENEQKAFKDTVEQAKKDYEQFKKDIETYDTLISDTIPGIQEAIQDELDKQIEIQIRKFTMEVEIRLDMAEAERDWNEFKRKVIDNIDEDDILGNAMSKMLDFGSYYKNNGKGSVQVLTSQVENTLEQLRQIDETGTSSVYGDNRAKAMEDLKTYYSQLMTELENVEDLIDEIEQSYLDMIDEANEKFDEQVDKYEYINDLFESNKNIIKLLKGDDAYTELGNYYEMQKENNNAELDFLRQEVDFWASKMDSEEQGSEAWQKYYENWKDATSSLNDTFERTLQNLIDEYNNTVNRVFDELNDSLTNGKGLEYVGEEWDLLKRNADQYLDTVNATYEIQKLQGKYMSAIDGSNSLYAQGKLNSLMEEQMKMLREKDKLTQYDVERANMLYDIAVKEIALKDAQQNKSQMRLRRDAQGNFSYQYVADDDAIGQAQQELADAKNSLYNLDKDAYRENLDQIYDIYVEFQEKLKELYADTTLSEEEREERKKLLTEEYEELINGIVEENTNIRLNLQQSTIDALAGYQDTVLMEQMVPGWNSGVQLMIDKFSKEGGLGPVCRQAMTDLDEATQTYTTNIGIAASKAGISLDSIYNGTDKAVTRTQNLVDTNDDLIAKYDEEISEIQDVQNELDTLVEKFEAAREKAIEAATAAHQYWMYVNSNIDFDKELPTPGGGDSPSGGSPNGDSPSGGSPNGDSPSGGSPNGGSPSNNNPYEGYYFVRTGTGRDGDVFTVYKPDGTSVKNAIGISYADVQARFGDIWRKGQYDTGGYTGQWPSGDKEGRLAFLHQKELVLNSEDTENILSAVDIVRSIGASMRDRINSLTSKFNNNNNITNNGMVIEQKVSIDARFEGQTESSQIETALINLVNYASQHAYDTTR